MNKVKTLAYQHQSEIGVSSVTLLTGVVVYVVLSIISVPAVFILGCSATVSALMVLIAHSRGQVALGIWLGAALMAGTGWAAIAFLSVGVIRHAILLLSLTPLGIWMFFLVPGPARG